MKNEAVVSFKKAVADNDLPSVERWLQRDPSLASVKNDNDVSVLLSALYQGHTEVAARIAAKNDALDIFEAAATGNLTTLRSLVDKAPDSLNSFSADGFTPLHLAAFFGRTEVVRFILANGGDVEAIARNPSHVRPLHSAAATRDARLVRVMLSAGANPDAKQAGGHTALHSAVLHGNVPMAIALLAAGADPGLKNDDGESALELEPSENRDSVASVLRTWSTMRTGPRES